jgi:iron complex outermembrane receptor protein
MHHNSNNINMSKLTPIATAAAILTLSVAMNAQAQQTTTEPETVIVSGIRGSLQQSLSVKRNASSNVDVITAEDVGKMPDKNVADSLQRVPGVNISTSGAGSGGFDENDRVSMRGTAPSLTQTLINGHAVSSGDWFVLDQVGGAVGRSASYSLLPSEIVGQVIVHKSPTADQIEGGSSGSIDIKTRHPLDFKNPISLEATIPGVLHAGGKPTRNSAACLTGRTTPAPWA